MRTEDIIAEWGHDRNRHPTVGENRTDSDISRMWDDSAKNYSSDRYSDIVDAIVTKLRSDGLLSGSVLDIGCGPGTFAFPFSETAGKVIAYDASIPMLDRLKERCRSERIANISTVVGDCRSIPQNIHCDLAFSSLCPPMNYPESILEMERHGDVCAYVSSANIGTSIETEIWSALGKDYSYSGYNTEYPYRFLRSVGRDPDLTFYTQKNTTEESEESVLKRHVSLISKYRPVTADIEKTIRKIVSGHSENGTITNTFEMRMGLLIWRPV